MKIFFKVFCFCTETEKQTDLVLLTEKSDAERDRMFAYFALLKFDKESTGGRGNWQIAVKQQTEKEWIKFFSVLEILPACLE